MNICKNIWWELFPKIDSTVSPPCIGILNFSRLRILPRDVATRIYRTQARHDMNTHYMWRRYEYYLIIFLFYYFNTHSARPKVGHISKLSYNLWMDTITPVWVLCLLNCQLPSSPSNIFPCWQPVFHNVLYPSYVNGNTEYNRNESLLHKKQCTWNLISRGYTPRQGLLLGLGKTQKSWYAGVEAYTNPD